MKAAKWSACFRSPTPTWTCPCRTPKGEPTSERRERFDNWLRHGANRSQVGPLGAAAGRADVASRSRTLLTELGVESNTAHAGTQAREQRGYGCGALDGSALSLRCPVRQTWRQSSQVASMCSSSGRTDTECEPHCTHASGIKQSASGLLFGPTWTVRPERSCISRRQTSALVLGSIGCISTKRPHTGHRAVGRNVRAPGYSPGFPNDPSQVSVMSDSLDRWSAGDMKGESRLIEPCRRRPLPGS